MNCNIKILFEANRTIVNNKKDIYESQKYAQGSIVIVTLSCILYETHQKISLSKKVRDILIMASIIQLLSSINRIL